jgi:hypothetical protein
MPRDRAFVQRHLHGREAHVPAAIARRGVRGPFERRKHAPQKERSAMRTLVVVTALVASSILAGCASVQGPELQARNAWSYPSSTRLVFPLGPDAVIDGPGAARATPLSRHEAMRGR